MIESRLKALGMPTLAIVAAAFLAGFAGGLGGLIVERFLLPEPGLAIVDLPTIIADHVTMPAVMSLPEEERSIHAAQFARQVDTEVAGLARDYNAVLLSAPAVVAGVPDLTPVLRARLGDAMAGSHGRR